METVHYGNLRNPLNTAAYKLYGRQIVFCGLHNGESGARGSTINYAEDIVLAVATALGVEPSQYCFYDLQTQSGYGHFHPGDYILNELRC